MKIYLSGGVIARARAFAAFAAFAALVSASPLAAAGARGGRTSGYGYGDLPDWNVKTNLLYDLTGTINLGAEFRLGGAYTLDLPFNYNPFQYKDNRKWKHFLAQPEVRRWFGDEVFSGHFVGANAMYAYYNIGSLPKPFSEYMRKHRFEGSAYGVGVSYGYRWNFSRKWGLEATLGVGYMYKDYDVHECGTCGQYLYSEGKHYFGPTKIGVNLVFGVGGQRVEAPAPVPIPQPVYKPEPYEPNLSTSYVIPGVEPVKERAATYTAYLVFEQGRSEIIANLRNNAAELRRIEEVTGSVTGDPSSTLTRVSITGYASPEGSFDHNQALSERRTEAVGNYVKGRYKISPNVFDVSGMGEDWETLDSLVGVSNIAGKFDALAVIRGGENPDVRENRLRQLPGETYRRVFNEVYPRLRRTDYRVEYTVKGFSVEEGKQVLKTNPRNLSLNELYLIANTYEPGSRQFNEVFETAVELFPTSDVANINAAAAAMERRDVVAAARYLANVKSHTSAYWNNLGVLQWLQGNKGGAADCFDRAGIQSMGNASEVARHFKSVE